MITFKKNSKNFQLFSPISFKKKEENIKNGNIITVLKLFGFVFSIYQLTCTYKGVNHVIYQLTYKGVNPVIYQLTCTYKGVNHVIYHLHTKV